MLPPISDGTSASEWVYTVYSSLNGHVEVDETPSSIFNQQEVIDGRVQFVHEWLDQGPLHDPTAGFNFTITHGNITTAMQTLIIDTSLDTHIMVNNQHAYIPEGGCVRINDTILDTNKQLDDSSGWVYTVITTLNGHVELDGETITTFTQDDLQTQGVVLVQDWTHIAVCSCAGFNFTVTYGDETSHAHELVLDIVSEVKFLDRNEGAVVFENGTTIIADSVLAANHSTSTEEWFFTVISTWSGHVEVMGLPAGDYTQEDLDHGRVTFIHHSEEEGGVVTPVTTAGFTFTVTHDILTSAPEDFMLVVLKDVMANNTGTAVPEGGKVKITGSTLAPKLLPGHETGEWVYDVVSTLNGQVALDGVQCTAYTQNDVEDGRVEFVHEWRNEDGSADAVAGVNFTITAEGTITSGVIPFNVVVVKDTIQFINKTQPSVPEGGSVPITNDVLAANTSSSETGEWVYTVVDTLNGHVEVDGEPASTFTQADIDNGRVDFVQEEWTEFSDISSGGFNFTVTKDDVTSPPHALQIKIIIINIAGAYVPRGGEVGISSLMLNSSNAFTDSGQWVYTVHLSLSGTCMMFGEPVTSFTQLDLIRGRVSYLHNGLQEDPRTSRTGPGFDFDLTSPSGKVSAVHFFPITILAEPTGEVARGGAIIVHVDDPSPSGLPTAPENIMFSATQVDDGQLLVDGRLAMMFSYSDILQETVVFVHNGNKEDDRASFMFTSFISGTESSFVSAITYVLAVVEVADVRVLILNTGTFVSEGSSATILESMLEVDVVDTAEESIEFVVSAIQGGKISRPDGVLVGWYTFTQKDIAAGNVKFVHDGSWWAEVWFEITVSDGVNFLAVQERFYLTITPGTPHEEAHEQGGEFYGLDAGGAPGSPGPGRPRPGSPGTGGPEWSGGSDGNSGPALTLTVKAAPRSHPNITALLQINGVVGDLSSVANQAALRSVFAEVLAEVCLNNAAKASTNVHLHVSSSASAASGSGGFRRRVLLQTGASTSTATSISIEPRTGPQGTAIVNFTATGQSMQSVEIQVEIDMEDAASAAAAVESLEAAINSGGFMRAVKERAAGTAVLQLAASSLQAYLITDGSHIHVGGSSPERGDGNLLTAVLTTYFAIGSWQVPWAVLWFPALASVVFCIGLAIFTWHRRHTKKARQKPGERVRGTRFGIGDETVGRFVAFAKQLNQPASEAAPPGLPASEAASPGVPAKVKPVWNALPHGGGPPLPVMVGARRNRLRFAGEGELPVSQSASSGAVPGIAGPAGLGGSGLPNCSISGSQQGERNKRCLYQSAPTQHAELQVTAAAPNSPDHLPPGSAAHAEIPGSVPEQ